MSLTDKIVIELVEAINGLTPDKIKAASKARVDALKLTDEEQAKRDEATAIIDSVKPKLADIDSKQNALNIATANLEKSIASYNENATKFEADKADFVIAKADFDDSKKALDKSLKEAEKANKKLAALNSDAESNLADILMRESSLSEKESIFSAAIKKIGG